MWECPYRVIQDTPTRDQKSVWECPEPLCKEIPTHPLKACVGVSLTTLEGHTGFKSLQLTSS